MNNNQDTRYPDEMSGSRNTLNRIIRNRDNNQTNSKFQIPNSKFGYWKLVIGYYLVIVSWLLVIGYGSSAYAVSGTTTDPSRTLFSARQLGMGGVSIAFSNDANGVFSNPSGLTGVEFPQLTASSRKIMLDETQYNLFGWAIPTNWGTFGIGYAGMGTSGSLPTTLDPGTGRIIQNPSLEAMGYENSVLALSYCRELPTPFKISVGGTFKSFNQSLSGSVSDRGTATNLDLAVTAKPMSWLTVGASLQNLLGGSVKWSSSEDKLGGYYRIGAGINILGGSEESLVINPQQQLRGGIDFDIPHNVLASSNSMLYHLGLEYSPLKNIALRAGLNQEVSGSGLTFGVGLTNGGFRFDYAYVERPGLPGDNPHYFSLSYIGERVVSISRKLKDKKTYVKISQPSDRLIADKDTIAISAEARATRILDQKTVWTVAAISETQEVKEVTETEDLKPIYLNGKEIEQVGVIETSSPLALGRNTFQIVGYTSPEVLAGKVTPEVFTASTEVKVLRFDPFKDTPMDHWAIEPIALSVTLGMIKGYPDKTFQPEKGITRAELVTLLVRTMPVKIEEMTRFTLFFSDVPSTHWAVKYISYGVSKKLATGYPDGTFKPNKVLTRAEGVTLLARYAGLSEEAKASPPFPDLKPDFWANKYVGPAKAAGMLKYLEGKNFEPSAPFPRAEACEVLYRVPAIQKRVNEFWETGIISASQ